MNRKSMIALAIMMGSAAITSQSAQASDWGCQVLLCLSDPRGPTTESECRPPIHKLWRELAKGHSFPSCAMAGSSDTGTGSFARQVYEWYDPCPEGTKPAEGYIAESTSPDPNTWRRLNYSLSRIYTGRGWYDRDEGGPTTRACVGNHMGTYRTGSWWGGDRDDRKTVQVYDKVVWQQPQNPRAIDVYIDGNLHQRVRW
ncbi:hypothetical protein QCD60_30560 [Pokkaliibacter sp. MBI-7]|uniref:hypothetical protein n=1 Tax=Pokkaliibacter sp. MBI-7 TaxID=3040600 RepID=UPI00244687E1|nr:hypothetical protein [Pokkaliibacter sp. MBI-7]MDH2436860.1 hypothetical protein [Pokkaliibacter sp. MBI-7]